MSHTNNNLISRLTAYATIVIAIALGVGSAQSQVLAITSESTGVSSIFRQVVPERGVTDGITATTETPARLRRQVVDYLTPEPPGTVIVDTPNTYLYLAIGGGKAIRYGIGVGREGFTWSGVKTIDRKTEWPDWFPPAEMVVRQPYLPRFMAGGPGNPLGARAMYIGGTMYRIHGTNAPETIGKRVSSGCIRLANEDVIDLYNRVSVGTKVVVLPISQHQIVQQRQTALIPIQPISARFSGPGLY